jgi:hypothetical protein
MVRGSMWIQDLRRTHALVERGLQVAALAVVTIMVAGCFCCTDYMWNLWALNDSDQDVLVHTTFAIPRTVRVPAHTYAPIDGGHGAVQQGWTVEVSDVACEPLQTLTLESGYDPLLYIAPDGRIDIRSGSAWTNTVASAKPAPTESPAPSPCPSA